MRITGQFNNTPLFTVAPVFWRDQWTWLQPRLREVESGKDRQFQSQNEDLPLQVSAFLTLENAGATLKINMRAANAVALRSGFSVKVSPRNGGEAQLRVSANKDSFSLKLPSSNGEIIIKSDPQFAALNYEQGRKDQIRAYLTLPNKISETHAFSVSIDMPKVCRIVDPNSRTQSAPDLAEWLSGFDDPLQTPIDLSFLNALDHPAGSRGRIVRDADRLAYPDGTDARFWGTNITANALFRTPKKAIKKQAKRLSKLGFNLVRIHHHDSDWVNPNIFGDRRVRTTTRQLSKASLKSLDDWIHALKEEGIYVWLDLHVGRAFTKRDGVEYFEDLKKNKFNNGGAKGLLYINKSLQGLWKEFAEQYLNHKNRHSGLRYAQDPAIVAIQLTNENDLTHHFGNTLLPDKNVPQHTSLFMQSARDFAAAHNLNPNKTWRSWEFGAPKLFLADLEHQFNAEMIAHVRDLGFKGVITTTSSWGKMSLAGHLSLTDGDMIDVHSYGKPGFLKSDPASAANLVDWMVAGQVSGFPMSVSEWNVSPFPAYDRSALPLYVASIAAKQGWDMLAQYAYTQTPPNRNARAGNWELFKDPSMLSMMPAAALAFRRGDISNAKTTKTVRPTRAEFIATALTPLSKPYRTFAPEQYRRAIVFPPVEELPWFKQVHAPIGNEEETSPQKKHSADSEIVRDWRNELLIIDTPLTQSIAGRLGGGKYATSQLTADLKTPFASVAVQSLNDLPLARTGKILISLAGQSVKVGNQMLAEPMIGTIAIKAKDGLSVFAVKPNGTRLKTSVKQQHGEYIIQLADHRVWTYLIMDDVIAQ